MSERFRVDLAGMVDLLSHHLYSGPHVYLRELLQNAVDALTARLAQDPDAPTTIRLSSTTEANGTTVLVVSDSGVGLTADEATELLATIGRSSKRDPHGLGVAHYLGQFGIGMLAAFMVADRIEVTSRSARPGTDPTIWVGHSDGTFDVSALPPGPAADAIPVGTTVRVWSRRGCEHWLETSTVVALATDYGSLLPFDVAVSVPVEGAEPMWRRITVPVLPWQVRYPTAEVRSRMLAAYCERVLGFTPLGHIDLSVPLAGVSGVAFILPQAVTPGSGRHRVYSKQMLVGARVDGVLPDWAFFTRAILNSDALSPTASREQIHDDEILLATREALGTQLKEWATATLTTPSTLTRRFVETHHLALRSLALTDEDMLDLAAQVLPFETTDGVRTLHDIGQDGEIVFTSTTEAFRRISAVARAQGLVVVNAGYVYDADLLARLGRRPGWQVRELSSTDITQVLALVAPAREAHLAAALSVAEAVLTDEDCHVLVRTFEPESLPAVLLRDPDGEHRRALAREREAAPGLWGGLLDALETDTTTRTRSLVLNDSSTLVQQLLAAPDGVVFAEGLRALYLSAVMLAGEGLRPREVASLHDALSVLLAHSLNRGHPMPDPPDPPDGHPTHPRGP